MESIVNIVDNNKQVIPFDKTNIEQKIDKKFIGRFVNNFNN